MATSTTARYDGLADWYDARYVAGAEPHQPGLREEPDPVGVPYSLAVRARRSS
ncbi:hypothetical protein OG555_09185 [Kribbella sp. NBC_01484]|uniref:hypothetical protein n=1 Tax=Kribbella sp. NBC_01484 TaxID=2903579 RepID=UPI002E3307FF|nr:hypothetical protein [Kribbella sp. NBC_01484]